MQDGVAARAVVRAFGAIDGWDFLLVLGAALVFAGLWLTLGLGVAMVALGGLLLAGGLLGARGKEMLRSGGDG